MKATMKPEKASSDFSFDIVIANVSVEFVNFEHHYPRLAFGMSFGSTSLEPVLGFAGFSRCIEARPGRFRVVDHAIGSMNQPRDLRHESDKLGPDGMRGVIADRLRRAAFGPFLERLTGAMRDGGTALYRPVGG
jgi:hypothetical protein